MGRNNFCFPRDEYTRLRELKEENYGPMSV